MSTNFTFSAHSFSTHTLAQSYGPDDGLTLNGVCTSACSAVLGINLHGATTVTGVADPSLTVNGHCFSSCAAIPGNKTKRTAASTAGAAAAAGRPRRRWEPEDEEKPKVEEVKRERRTGGYLFTVSIDGEVHVGAGESPSARLDEVVVTASAGGAESVIGVVASVRLRPEVTSVRGWIRAA